MNREIKFRGYSEELKSFVYGFYQEVESEGIGYSYIFWQGNTTYVRADSVAQFTGMYDKNGKEIYEGDIVTYKRSVGNWTRQTMTTTHKIIFTEEVNAFVMEYGSSYIKLRKHWCYEYEVIGNIFENPELL